ncbi:hypothetical protein FJR41_017015 [Dolichospermum planctonicum UHCC 0167]|jgi:hypothetical protein|uniref:hypothetical protein n=1 Tax=Dolichospermum planctonicum TaxID=136072 RepID=UPI0022463D8B|nr:hypothetical protein [Dolichospermum planctonicum]MCW9682475.1 hypothetical protein [Dolichospermum planctonicum UHCC 0167]
MAAYYISFILILNILQHIYGIMASVLDIVVFGIVPKVPFPEGICWGADKSALASTKSGTNYDNLINLALIYLQFTFNIFGKER